MSTVVAAFGDEVASVEGMAVSGKRSETSVKNVKNGKQSFTAMPLFKSN